MIQITPQMRILLAVEPVDFRNHSACLIIPSRAFKSPKTFGLSGQSSVLDRNNQRPRR